MRLGRASATLRARRSVGSRRRRNGGGGGEGGGGQNGGGDLPRTVLSSPRRRSRPRPSSSGSVASDEAKDLSLAATRKVMELGERRREKRADKHNATAAAMREAEDAGLDIEEIEGTGADGRVTLRDVQKALKR